MQHTNPRVVVAGATGAVGRVMLEILKQRNFPAAQVVAAASPRSAGMQLQFGGSSLTVQPLDEAVFEGADLVLLDTPDEVAARWAPKAVEAGAVVIDNSAAWRMQPDVPLVVPEVNPQAAYEHRGIIASPNCTTIGVVVPLAALHRRFGLRRIIVSSYQATSGAGRGGVEELAEQAQKLAGELESLAAGDAAGLAPQPHVFAAPIAFNVIPQIGSIKENGFSSEELKLSLETRKIMGLPALDAVATCVRVPTVVGHGSSVYAEFDTGVDAAEAEQALEQAPGVKLTGLPNPLEAAGTDACYVGRVRAVPGNERALCFFTVSDNLRKGAALNTIQIAELLSG